MAQDVGLVATRADLGWPGERTARRWVTEAGLDIEGATQQVRARALQDAYHDAEQAAVCSALLDHVMQTLEAGEIIDVVGPEGEIITVMHRPGRVLARPRLAHAAQLPRI